MSDPVENVADALRKVFMAGVGAVATVGEKGGQVGESLAERGENVVKQGKDLNQELVRKTTTATADVREEMLRGVMAVMSPEVRAGFVDMAARVAADLNARDAEKAGTAPEAASPAEGQAESGCHDGVCPLPPLDAQPASGPVKVPVADGDAETPAAPAAPAGGCGCM